MSTLRLFNLLGIAPSLLWNSLLSKIVNTHDMNRTLFNQAQTTRHKVLTNKQVVKKFNLEWNWSNLPWWITLFCSLWCNLILRLTDLYKTLTKTICIRPLMGSTDQADPSCFYFRISWILMEQRCFYFFCPLRFLQPQTLTTSKSKYEKFGLKI